MLPFLRRVAALTAALMLVPVAAALAALPGSSTTSTTTTTTPSPAKGSLKLTLPGLFLVHGQLIGVDGRGFTVQGVVQPYVAGQSVTVQELRGHHLFKREHVLIKPSRNKSSGRFSARLVAPSAGDVTVLASHGRSTGQLRFQARRGFLAVARGADFGATGRFVQLIQQQLAALHFYLPQTGVYDGGTGLAIDAYHRLLGWGTSQTLDSRTISFLLNGWGQFKVRYPGHGRHAEGDLHNQLLALINGAKADLIFPISSGKPSTPTVLGDFHIYRRVPGYQPDGMYYSSYFYGGYAIHGYNPAPDYPASHGCMRAPIADAITIYSWLTFGEWVDVYN